MRAAIKVLRKELRAFRTKGLWSLAKHIEAGRTDPAQIPTRRTWRGCPLSYREGERGSVSTDMSGAIANDFTIAWDGCDGEYFDELVLLREVNREIARRDKLWEARKNKQPQGTRE